MNNSNNASNYNTINILIGLLIIIVLYMLYNYYHIDTHTNYNETFKKGIINDSIKSNKKKVLKIYHMNGCGHCNDIMLNKQSNGLTKFEELKKILEPKNIEVVDYLHGRDDEANKYNAFPVIIFEVDGIEHKYNNSRDVNTISASIIKH